ncbi:hypothetical protein RCL1_004137 [Eukaryota sp. TZLM3-RCL]
MNNQSEVAWFVSTHGKATRRNLEKHLATLADGIDDREAGIRSLVKRHFDGLVSYKNTVDTLSSLFNPSFISSLNHFHTKVNEAKRISQDAYDPLFKKYRAFVVQQNLSKTHERHFGLSRIQHNLRSAIEHNDVTKVCAYWNELSNVLNSVKGSIPTGASIVDERVSNAVESVRISLANSLSVISKTTSIDNLLLIISQLVILGVPSSFTVPLCSISLPENIKKYSSDLKVSLFIAAVLLQTSTNSFKQLSKSFRSKLLSFFGETNDEFSESSDVEVSAGAGVHVLSTFISGVRHQDIDAAFCTFLTTITSDACHYVSLLIGATLKNIKSTENSENLASVADFIEKSKTEMLLSFCKIIRRVLMLTGSKSRQISQQKSCPDQPSLYTPSAYVVAHSITCIRKLLAIGQNSLANSLLNDCFKCYVARIKSEWPNAINNIFNSKNLDPNIDRPGLVLQLLDHRLGLFSTVIGSDFSREYSGVNKTDLKPPIVEFFKSIVNSILEVVKIGFKCAENDEDSVHLALCKSSTVPLCLLYQDTVDLLSNFEEFSTSLSKFWFTSAPSVINDLLNIFKHGLIQCQETITDNLRSQVFTRISDLIDGAFNHDSEIKENSVPSSFIGMRLYLVEIIDLMLNVYTLFRSCELASVDRLMQLVMLSLVQKFKSIFENLVKDLKECDDFLGDGTDLLQEVCEVYILKQVFPSFWSPDSQRAFDSITKLLVSDASMYHDFMTSLGSLVDDELDCYAQYESV